MAKKTISETNEETGIERFDVIDGFVLENSSKLERVVFGDVKRAGVPEGGLGEEAAPMLVLAHYDKIGGLITKDVGGDKRVKIKNGAFWDIRKKCPREVPVIRYMFKVAGEEIEVDDPSNLAKAVTMVETALSEKEENNRARRERAKKRSLIKGE